MTDRRRFWSEASDHEIAEASRVKGFRIVEPQVLRVVMPVTDLYASPLGARDRQLLRGQAFAIRAAEDESGCVYGETQADRYSGWIDGADLYTHPPEAPTHRLVAQSYGKTNGGLKAPGLVTHLSMSSEIVVVDEVDGWSRIAWTRGRVNRDLFVPSVHLGLIAQHDTDPVTVAERMTRAPYLWGGNSSFGIDCSGLVQAACLACGIPCPGDSDMQEAELGVNLPDGALLQRGDLLFWKGHVAWVVDPETILHANAYHMAVAFEPMAEAIARIEAQGYGPVTARKRLETPT